MQKLNKLPLPVKFLLAGMLIASCSGVGASDPAPYRHENPVEYFLYVPDGYAPDRNWPLFVGIHGFGGSGKDCWSIWQPYADTEGFLLLCPSIADQSGGWYQSAGEAIVVDLLRRVDQGYSIRPRVFLAGFSAGAQFVQGFAFNNYNAVGGAAVLSSGNYYPGHRGASNIPFLVIIGDRDNKASVQGAKDFNSILRQNGNPVEFHILKGVGHSITKDHKELTIDFFRRTVGQ
jgi:predicted esterase